MLLNYRLRLVIPRIHSLTNKCYFYFFYFFWFPQEFPRLAQTNERKLQEIHANERNKERKREKKNTTQEEEIKCTRLVNDDDQSRVTLSCMAVFCC